MQKKFVIILLVMFVALISTGYSVFLGDFNSNQSNDVGENNNSQGIGDFLVADEKVNMLSPIKEVKLPLITNDMKFGANNLIKNYGSENSFYNHSFFTYDNGNLNDRYIQCAVCGRLIPIGSISHMLPINAICNGVDDELGVGESEFFMHNTLSYDEAYEVWENYLISAENSGYGNLSYYDSNYWHQLDNVEQSNNNQELKDNNGGEQSNLNSTEEVLPIVIHDNVYSN